MLIEVYLQQFHDIIQTCSVVHSFNIEPDNRGDYQGFIRGEINFMDASILYLREFVNVQTIINRGMYSYQYMDASNRLIFRYDNTKHHRKLNLPTYPHHKHEGSEDNILPSTAPMFADVLKEIELLLG